jgi:predicted SAM-dependent methyltransferase
MGSVTQSLRTAYLAAPAPVHKAWRAVKGIAKQFIETRSADRLHLGCGTSRLDGFCNVDARRFSGVDVVSDVATLRRFKSSSASLIYASHVLEHFPRKRTAAILRRWHEILKPGGELRVSVPDLGRLAELYHQHSGGLSDRDLDLWLGVIYGGQDGALDFHAAGFTFAFLRRLLEECGFENIREYPHQPHFWPGGRDAASEAAFCGEYLSLNVVATKRAS